jgi:hypothetical protein
MIAFLRRLHKYLWRRDVRPRLPRGYHRADDTAAALAGERLLIATRRARTPAQARELILLHGSVEAVLRGVKPPERKRAPVGKRLLRVIRHFTP